MKQALVFFIALSLCTSCASIQKDESAHRHAFHASFTEHLEGSGSGSLAPEQYTVSFVDLNDDDMLDAVALVSRWDTGYAGSGGGTLFVFAGTRDGTYSFISKSTLTREPVHVRKTTNRGWRDLVVHSSGGGIQPSDRILVFDGNSYPANPSVEPKTRITKQDSMILGSTESNQPSGNR